MADPKAQLPRTTRVKNKQPADKQITAEQLLREAKEIQLEDDYKAPKQIITDAAELAEYRLSKRKQFEDLVRRVGRFNGGVWVKYATWEEQQKDFRRARSVWERALAIEYRNVSLWLKYAEMEMRHRFVNHARNVWDRAVSLLPRFELRYSEVERARATFERYVQILPSVKAWVRYAKFEMQNGEVALARRCYERAVEELGEDGQTEEFFIKFAEFEEKAREVERARAIYRYALDHIPKSYIDFEISQGERERVRLLYTRLLDRTKHVKVWLSYARFEAAPMPAPEGEDG
ncbi:hypothetical protein GPECTOR_494g448 [Gonium pectorale]|uniref:Pre-mRNA-splicing factor Syf1-like N-terminal HAT-repeats domain-containing protein n=1 Tax=Gonium pectorale TaxID=33097 RepID=A0A150FUW8_GONPE|nr:hypothetical protein GPECTOR_494g448 [Gonium pectorale]|eukprot:KXZ41396.1 hypothetical protein GPECTOR_494g448 [Gonium pectorale]